jgi:hypothetical protein
LHTLLGTGTALAPLIVSLLAEGGAWWLLPASIAAAVVVLPSVALTQPLALPSAGGEVPTLAAAAVARALPLRFWVWIAFAMASAETLFGNWGTVYLHQQRALPDATANLALAVFWAAVTVGRLLVAVIAARRVPPLVIFRALPVLIAIALMCVAFSQRRVRRGGVRARRTGVFRLPPAEHRHGQRRNAAIRRDGLRLDGRLLHDGVRDRRVCRQVADLALSDVYFGATAVAVVLILLADLLARGAHAADPSFLKPGARS